MSATPIVLSERIHAPANGEINLSELMETLLQYRWRVIGIFLLVLGAGAAYVQLATPIYRADALIQVEDKKTTMLSGVQQLSDTWGGGSSPVTGEIEILRSREVILKAVKATRADIRVSVSSQPPLIGNWFARYHADATAPVAAPFGLDMFSWGGERLRVDELSVPESQLDKPFKVRADGPGKYQLEDHDGKRLGAGTVGRMLDFTVDGQPGRLMVADMRAGNLTTFKLVRAAPVTAYRDILQDLSIAESGRQSSIMRVSYEHPDVKLAQDLVNAIASAYLKQNVERRNAEAYQSLQFLDEQLPGIKRDVERAEELLNNFRTRTNTVSVERSTETLLNQAVEVEKGRLQLQLRRDDLAQRYTPDHPELKALEAQLAETARVNTRVNDQVNRLPAAQRDLLRLQRDAEVANQMYIALLNNAQQLKVAKAGTVGNVRVVDFAVADFKAVAPKKIIIVCAAAALGLALGVLAAVGARMLRPTVRDAEDAERATGLVSYASIPESPFQDKMDLRSGRANAISTGSLLALLRPDDPAVESLRSLRTGLGFALMDASNKSIVVTSATAALGKSFVSANLSVLLVSSGRRVLLIDTDLRRPKLGAYFGYGRVAGLSNLLNGSATLDAVLRKRILPEGELHIIPAGQLPPNPSELLSSARFAELLKRLERDYDHVILDSAPVLPVSDTLGVVNNAATVFLVVRAEHSTADDLREAMKKLESAGTVVKGIIFNGVKRRRLTYGNTY
ncbi:polysaccharide biosynthesis tyrosine autokinase [Pigmentiphaga aceris]|uniref:Putative tyrosine-protein kinase EpsB n=1 Tax=Pigmentiphaga aceris TaxID=1940612 RepID=A0A5C0AZZ3_9BURK|nr:polysaccharide biosynthesis tyrosine autokinase [Pigmentiphaga aceris]QEI07194.1 polysaccharide biosynthesis tyrosine autokinase [Pigmentiphaga aceris]